MLHSALVDKIAKTGGDKRLIHQILELPRGQKFLFGFSGGADSSALFFLLLDYGIEFDLAIVDYGTREESKEEVAYAQELARLHHKEIYILEAPKIEKNFEACARKIRYEFFGEILKTRNYRGVILAHQLNDKIEWFLMQFQKGAGLNTLLGFTFCERFQDFDVFRPLLGVSKEEIYNFCRERNITFFEDLSNQDENFLRNRVRKLSSFLAENSKTIRASFEYLQEEKEILYPPVQVEYFGAVRAFKRRGEREDLYALDLECKKLGYLLSAKQRQEIVRCGFSCQVNHLVIDCNESKIFLAPKLEARMSRVFRDFARKHKVPKRIRIALYFYLLSKKCDDEEKIVAFIS